MKKNLLYLFALICSVSLFTACSDDDDNSWQELPKGEIKAENVDFQLNGTNTTGTVNFEATSLQSATVGFKNVVDGYSDITVDVTMEKQADGSFKFNGTKDIMTKPVTRETSQPAPLLKVTVDGMITPEGKVTLNVSATGAGLYIGTYKDETLVLTYGETLLTGKEVVFDATNGDNVTILLKNVIPGEEEATLTGVKVDGEGFSGTAKTANASVEYTGSRKDKVLTLSLKVTMNDPKGWAKTYGLAEYTTGELTYNDYTNPNAVIAGAGYVNYVCVTESSDYGTSYGAMFRGIFGVLLPQVLQSVTLGVDGNVTASYNSGAIQFQPMWALMPPTADVAKKLIPTEGWLQSPTNLAYWFEKDGKLYVKLNIPVIVAQAMGSGAAGLDGIIDQVLKGDPATVKAMLAKLLKVESIASSDKSIAILLDCVNNGFPLNVKVADGHSYIYLDKSAFAPLMAVHETGEVDSWGDPVKMSDILILWDMLSKSGILPPEAAMASMLIGAISGNWEATEAFDLGLDLQAK